MTRRRAGGERADGMRRSPPSPTDAHIPRSLTLHSGAAIGCGPWSSLARRPGHRNIRPAGYHDGDEHAAIIGVRPPGGVVQRCVQRCCQQRFRTGPNPAGYELDGITLYVRDTRESRYMTIVAGLYRRIGDRYVHVTNLSRGQLDDFAHNEWWAPADTYLKGDYVRECRRREGRPLPGLTPGWRRHRRA